KYNFGILKMDNNASNNSSNNNLPPNNIVRSHEPSHNTYDSDSDSSIRTTQEIFIRMSAAQPSSSHNESRTRHASRSIERHNESRNESHTHHTSRSIECDRSFSPERRRSQSLSCSQRSSNQNQLCESYVDELLFKQNRQLYLLVHKLGNDIREIKDELKHLRGDPKKDLSAKDMYTNVIKRLFPNHLYPSQCELKKTIKEYMNENFPEFVRNIGEVEFTN
ncbi:42955_t:CDS:2, partial [Gigaspora margarita]